MRTGSRRSRLGSNNRAWSFNDQEPCAADRDAGDEAGGSFDAPVFESARVNEMP